MALCHVTIIGHDRPHLQALGRTLRAIVVSAGPRTGGLQ